MKLKRFIYLSLFVLLGLGLTTLLHAIIELPVIYFLVIPGVFHLQYKTWVYFHNILTLILAVSGILIGYYEGQYWWKYIYLDKKLDKKKYFLHHDSKK